MFKKRLPTLLLGVCSLLPFSLLPLSPARAASSSNSSSGQIDVNFFYESLKDDGSWFNTTEFGDVWQPYIAYKSDSWRPYTDGYWSYTDGGWMFVSNENFGWAVYHYGRWTKLQDIGWAWVPGTEWAPAWVTWRESKPDAATGAPAADAPVSATNTTAPDGQSAPPPPPAAGNDGPRPGGAAPSENYIGWAPLPPEPIAVGTDYSYGPTVDVDFGIDPYAYVFTDYRSFGSPWIAGVIFDSDRGYYCCDHSVNITNVYYNRDGRGYRGFYNGGPNYDRFRGVTERPIPQLALRQTTSAALVRQQIRSGQFNRVNGNQINVAAPRFSQTNVRNGRVNFTKRGTLPVTPVAKQLAPAAAANNPGYQRARESFTRQGEAARVQRPNARPAAPTNNPGAATNIATTPRARREERQARQQAERQGTFGQGAPAAANQPPARETREARREARRTQRTTAAAPERGEAVQQQQQRQVARQSRREARQAERQTAVRQPRGGGGEERAMMRQQRQQAPRMERQQAPRMERGGGGGGERRGGGGGGENGRKRNERPR